jgi:methylated-DNA-[protein]-cysteine S-methyltransferase
MKVSARLDDRFRAAALADGLLDVAYDLSDSPLGPLLLARTERGLCRIEYDPEPEHAAGVLARAFGLRVLRAPGSLDDARRQLDEYFEGRRHAFELDVDLGLATKTFSRRVLKELARVPYGEVTTYGALAARAGHPRAARAVGTVMNRNPIPIVLPCHRVVGASGSLVGYGGGLARKQALLRLESAELTEQRQ